MLLPRTRLRWTRDKTASSEECGAGDGNRTHGSSLGSLGITIIRRPLPPDSSRLSQTQANASAAICDLTDRRRVMQGHSRGMRSIEGRGSYCLGQGEALCRAPDVAARIPARRDPLKLLVHTDRSRARRWHACSAESPPAMPCANYRRELPGYHLSHATFLNWSRPPAHGSA